MIDFGIILLREWSLFTATRGGKISVHRNLRIPPPPLVAVNNDHSLNKMMPKSIISEFNSVFLYQHMKVNGQVGVPQWACVHSVCSCEITLNEGTLIRLSLSALSICILHTQLESHETFYQIPYQ